MQIPQEAVLIPKDSVLKRKKEEHVRNLYMVYDIVIPLYVGILYMRYDIYILLYFKKQICKILAYNNL